MPLNQAFLRLKVLAVNKLKTTRYRKQMPVMKKKTQIHKARILSYFHSKNERERPSIRVTQYGVTLKWRAALMDFQIWISNNEFEWIERPEWWSLESLSFNWCFRFALRFPSSAFISTLRVILRILLFYFILVLWFPYNILTTDYLKVETCVTFFLGFFCFCLSC